MLPGLNEETLKPPGPGDDEARERQHDEDQDLEPAEDEHRASRQRHAEQREERHDGDEDEEDQVPVEVPAVLRLERVAQQRSRERADGADRDRVVQEVDPRGQPAGARADRLAHVQEVAAGTCQVLRELRQHHGDAEADHAADHVRDRRRQPGEADDEREAEQHVQARGDVRHPLDDHAEQPQGTGLQLGVRHLSLRRRAERAWLRFGHRTAFLSSHGRCLKCSLIAGALSAHLPAPGLRCRESTGEGRRAGARAWPGVRSRARAHGSRRRSVGARALRLAAR